MSIKNPWRLATCVLIPVLIGLTILHRVENAHHGQQVQALTKIASLAPVGKLNQAYADKVQGLVTYETGVIDQILKNIETARESLSNGSLKPAEFDSYLQSRVQVLRACNNNLKEKVRPEVALFDAAQP